MKHTLDLATASGQATAVREFLDAMERRTRSEPVCGELLILEKTAIRHTQPPAHSEGCRIRHPQSRDLTRR